MSVPNIVPNILFCESDFFVIGKQTGEDLITLVRIASTFITLTVASAWTWKKISKLNLFFSHWFAGLVLELLYEVEFTMISLCWTKSSVTGFIKTLKFVELVAGNMLAITNLAICINLAFIVSSHRTMNRVRSVSSPRLILLFFVISAALAAAAWPFLDQIFVLSTAFWMSSTNQRVSNFLVASIFYTEFFVGICMFIIVAWLAVYRMDEIRQCWKIHARIRYYFGLTILATVVNLGLGICGTLYLTIDNHDLLLVWSWFFRYVHIALDTLVLYGVLRERTIDERADGKRSSPPAMPGASSFSSGPHKAVAPHV